MKVLVFGAGAMGTYIGGSLALKGSRVAFIEREEVCRFIVDKGLHLEINGIISTICQPEVFTSLEQALLTYTFDVAIIAVKSNDTNTLIQSVAPYKSQMPPVLCLQNGVENEAILAATLGGDKVIPGTVTSAVGRRNVGDIILEKKRGVGITSTHQISRYLTNELNGADLNAHLYRDPKSLKWSKMITNLLVNATSAILNMAPAEIIRHPELFKLEVRQLREAFYVMKTLGIQTINLPKVPVRVLAFCVEVLPYTLSRLILSKVVGSGRGGKMPSFHIDLYSGKGMSEVEYLNGAVVRFGKQMGINTPVNYALNQILLDLVNKNLPLQTYDHQPAKLLAAINCFE